MTATDERGAGIHWVRSPEAMVARCGAEIDPNRHDWRDDALYVRCPECRWRWLVETVSDIRSTVDALKRRTDV